MTHSNRHTPLAFALRVARVHRGLGSSVTLLMHELMDALLELWYFSAWRLFSVLDDRRNIARRNRSSFGTATGHRR